MDGYAPQTEQTRSVFAHDVGVLGWVNRKSIDFGDEWLEIGGLLLPPADAQGIVRAIEDLVMIDALERDAE